MLGKSKRLLVLPLYAVLSAGLPALAWASEWPLNMTEGVTSISRQVHGLHMQIFWWCVAIGVVVFGVMFYTMFVHRKSRGVKPAHFHENVALELTWTIIPILILVAMAVPATKTLVHIYDTEDADLDILITGYQWKWKYEYLDENGDNISFFSLLSTPRSQIENAEAKSPEYLLEVDEPVYIPIGKKVRFLVTAADVIHSWWVPALAVKRDAIPGYIHEAWTKVEQPGVFRGQCTELCGKDHGFMPVVVHAVEQAEFDAWLEGKREKARQIAEAVKQTLTFQELYDQGEAVYQKNCAACHQPDGKGIPGTFPAIIRSPIATGPVAGHINRVVNGGAGMPPFGEQLTPVEIAAVVTFQRNAFGNNMGDQIQPIDVVNFKQGQ
ncbi:cytochrome c oxidase subunit II [Saccharophagus sp. K07]|uniref:cytochrome c oxidase subunit II n=1 Tax=Saccharophagus sp. K07 TaxID=2283636 RepID=UPI001651F0A6|nr:cytochrome c oxidase subunit II [Saccharophagus sp. K07]MBC6906175.1 cytochrome c oxidase subunit II [Saccharophagus sp. K07]